MDGLRDVIQMTGLRKSTVEWLIAFLIMVVVIAVFAVGKRWLAKRMKALASRTPVAIDDVVAAVFDNTRFVFYSALAVYLASRHLALAPGPERWIRTAVILVTLWQLGIWLQTAVRGASDVWRVRHGDDGGAKTMAAATAFVSSLAIWSVLFISALSTLGFEISALVAGLGVGGVAAALAVQNLLGDVFASLSIYFDRPFDIGDFIIVGSELGTVERIGLRTTRVRSLGGEEIIFGNGDLIKSRIRNYKRMAERRVVFGFGVEYRTPPEALESIPPLVRSIIESRQGLRFDRAHFKEYAQSSLAFEVVYYVLSSDFNVYMDHQQAINFTLFREFAARDIKFAIPAQTVFLAGPQGPQGPQGPNAPQGSPHAPDGSTPRIGAPTLVP